MIKLTVDLLGADRDERELLRGAVQALQAHPDLFLYLCGHREVLSPILEAEPTLNDRYEIVDSPVALTNHDDPMAGCRNENASMIKGMRLVKEGTASGIVTCGATGCVLVSAITILGKLKGLRPILAVELQNMHGEPLLLLDCGANIDSRPELYTSFAHLGDAYMHSIGCTEPRIALLSNGAEDTKGCEAVKAANKLLRAMPLNFIGNVEPTSALSGKTDVIVCDGFHGNILLKSIEGVAKAVLTQLGERLIHADADTKAVLKETYDRYDFNARGGAMLLGVKAPVMKGHGAATGEAIAAMLARMLLLCKNGFLERVEHSLA